MLRSGKYDDSWDKLSGQSEMAWRGAMVARITDTENFVERQHGVDSMFDEADNAIYRRNSLQTK